jgi:putative ABC transport system permease protein
MDDVRLSIRALQATPIVSIVAALSLALGIGANTAIFSLLNSLLLRTLPVKEPGALVTISSDAAIRLGFKAGLGWNYAMWDRLRQRSQPFDGAVAWTPQRINLVEGGESQPAEGLVVSGDFFTTLGVGALLGRTFTSADDVRGGGADGPVTVISYGLWQRRLGGSGSVIGTSLPVEGVPFTIVGVTPPEFFGLEVGKAFDLALPLGAEPLIFGKKASIDQPRSLLLFIMLRLKPGQSLDAATATMRTLQPEILTPDLPQFVKQPFTLVPAAGGTDTPNSVRPRYERSVLTIFVVVALVLLIASANIANLQLARATARRHELSVRLALGAPRWRLARQLLVESLVLASIGALGGLVFAVWASRALVAQLSTSVNRLALDLPLDWRVLAFTAAVACATAMLCGTAPAFRAARVAPIDALRDHGRSTSADAKIGIASGLVVAQVALSLVLVAAAGLFVRTLERLAKVPLGFDGDRVLVVNVDTARAHIDPADRIALYQRLAGAAASAPGVTHAAGSASTPVSAGLPRNVDVSGAPPGSEHLALVNAVTPGWFAVYGTGIHAGRDIDAHDTATAQLVVIVNEAFARRFFPGRTAIGETVAARTVVGVAGDQIVQGGYKPSGALRTMRDEAPPSIYVPVAQSAGMFAPDSTAVSISVRSAAGSPAPLARGVGAALTAVNPDVAFSIRPLADYLHASLAQERMVAMLAGFFGALALLLAALGLYGMTSYAVSRRRAEIGIRLALGAAPAGVIRLVLTRVVVLVCAGVLVGAAASAWLSQFVAPLLYGLEPRDPITLVSAALTLGAVGMFAGWLPAARAARIDPADVLRES